MCRFRLSYLARTGRIFSLVDNRFRWEDLRSSLDKNKYDADFFEARKLFAE